MVELVELKVMYSARIVEQHAEPRPSLFYSLKNVCFLEAAHEKGFRVFRCSLIVSWLSHASDRPIRYSYLVEMKMSGA